MNQRNSMKPVLIGAVVAALIIGAFFLGQTSPFEEEGPAERLGESIDQAAEEMKEGMEQLPQEGEGAGN